MQDSLTLISIGPAHCYAEWLGHTLVLKAAWSLSVHTTVAAWNVCMLLRPRLSLHEGHIYWELLSYARHKCGGKTGKCCYGWSITAFTSLATSRGFQVLAGSGLWHMIMCTGRYQEERSCNVKCENLLLCECFIAQQEIRKVFMICHKTVDMLAKYNKHTGNGTKWKSRFVEYGWQPEWDETPQTQMAGKGSYLLLLTSI